MDLFADIRELLIAERERERTRGGAVASRKVIIGGRGSGKKSLLAAIEWHGQTRAVQHFSLEVLQEGEPLGAVAEALVVYDCTSRASFDRIPPLLDALYAASPRAKAVLVANKCDLESRQVTLAEGESMARTQTPTHTPLEHYQVSAKTGKGIHQIIS